MFFKAFTHNSKLAKNEPGWGSVDKGKLPQAAFARKGANKSDWGFPHHWIQNGSGSDDNGCYTSGTMYLHRGGLGAAWSAANGGRSGKPAEAAVKAHLRAHYAALGITPAALQALDPTIDVAAVDAELLAAGLLTQRDLDEPDVSALISRFIAEFDK